MITKEMLKRCLNEKMQAFCALDKDVQDAINGNKSFQQCLYHIAGRTSWKNDYDENPMPNYVYRLSPDTPTEPDWEELSLSENKNGFRSVCDMEADGYSPSLTLATSHVRFLGIIYTLNGVETLRTSIDAAFGVPVRVRFSK